MTNGVYASNLDSSISRFLATRIVIHLYCLSHCKALCHFAFKCILTYIHILCPCIDICYVYTFLPSFISLDLQLCGQIRPGSQGRKGNIFEQQFINTVLEKNTQDCCTIIYQSPTSNLAEIHSPTGCDSAVDTVKYIPHFLISKTSNLNQGTLRKSLALTFYTSCSVY